MTFTPFIPDANVRLADSQQPIQDNFTAINSVFGINHVDFLTPLSQGFHKFVSFKGVNPAAAIPVSTEGITMVAEYMPNVGLEERQAYALFYRQNSVAHPDVGYQITGTQVPVNAALGATYLPGGLMIQWGQTPVIPAGTSPDIPFAMDFDIPPYSVVISAIKLGGGSGLGMFVKTTSITKHKFNIVNEAGGGHDAFWIAIGPRV